MCCTEMAWLRVTEPRDFVFCTDNALCCSASPPAFRPPKGIKRQSVYISTQESGHPGLETRFLLTNEYFSLGFVKGESLPFGILMFPGLFWPGRSLGFEQSGTQPSWRSWFPWPQSEKSSFRNCKLNHLCTAHGEATRPWSYCTFPNDLGH